MTTLREALHQLQQEHAEDQAVIAVWRGRAHRAEAQRDALREAAEPALEALEQWNKPGYTLRNKRAAAAVRAALAEPTGKERLQVEPTVAENATTQQQLEDTPRPMQEPQTTHSEECWRWHHDCAVAEIQRLRARGEK